MQQLRQGVWVVLALLGIGLGLVLVLFVPAGYAQVQANLESPSPGSFQTSGVGLIRGWVCQASRVEVSLDGGLPMLTAYGTERPDTATVCGDTNNGFGLTYNWNRAGDGVHTLEAFADGVKFAHVNFVVTTLGSEYPTGLTGEYTVPDFPVTGKSAMLRWSEPQQNFVVVSSIIVPPVNNPPVVPRAMLESPTQGSSESGVGLIRGWVCQASRVEVSLDGGLPMLTAYGTERPDTATVCGDTNNGFGLTYNWNRAGDGSHNLRAFADGVAFANVNFAVTTLGGEYLTGLISKIRLLGFPPAGISGAVQAQAADQAAATSDLKTTVQWSEPDQNFLISSTTVTGTKLALVSAITDLSNRFAVQGLGANQTESTGAYVNKDASGTPTQVNGVTWTEPVTGRWTDVALDASGLPTTYRDSSGIKAQFSQFTTGSVNIEFFDPGGRSLGEPVTAPLDVSLVIKLQQLANQIKTSAPAVARLTAPATTPAGFSLNPILVDLFATGGGAEGELLCAVQAAGLTAGVSNLTASLGCKSPLLKGLLSLFTRPRIQADTSTAAGTQSSRALKTGSSSILADTPAADAGSFTQTAFDFSSDVPEAPCGTADSSADCLNPATEVLQIRAAQPVTEVPPTGSTDYSLNLTAIGSGSGTISGGGRYPAGTAVTLTATPDANSTFSGWNPSPCAAHFTMPAQNLTCTATFIENSPTSYTVTASAGFGGTISPSSQTVDPNAIISFNVTAVTDYRIATVTGCGGSFSGTTTSGVYTTGPITADCTVDASFVPDGSSLLR